MSEIKCTEHGALPREEICVAASPRPGMVLDCSSKVPLSQPQAEVAVATSPRREEENMGGVWVGSDMRGMLSSSLLLPIKSCQSCRLFSHQLSRARARAAKPAGTQVGLEWGAQPTARGAEQPPAALQLVTYGSDRPSG